MRTAVYAGSFDPITNGHLSVVERAIEIFDLVIVLVAVNPEKRPLFSAAERMDLILEATASWAGVEVASTERLVVDFARARGARFLARGVRGATDTEYEIALATANLELATEVTTIFIPARPDLAEISSSRLKALAASGADLTGLCPSGVARRLSQRYGMLNDETAR